MSTIRVAIAQINTVVGDLIGNTEKILLCINEAQKKDSDLIVFPELAITGYPPEDLLLKPLFIKENLKCLNAVAKASKDIITIVGFAHSAKDAVYNSAAVAVNKKLAYVYNKRNLPNYGVFDEKRYFASGGAPAVIKAKDYSFMLNICEDIWVPEDPYTKRAIQKAGFLINLSASPYHLNRIKERRGVIGKKAARFKIPIVYCNLIGGQDELVFDGRSAIFGKNGKVLAEAKAFEEDFLVSDLVISSKRKAKGVKINFISIDHKAEKDKSILSKHESVRDMNRVEEVYSALVLGVRDYVRKNNFKKVALGISGGIDSALVACIAVDALGKANVLAVSMPSEYSSKGTQDDAEKISRNLGIRFAKVPIDGILNEYINSLSGHFTGMKTDITEENIQARIRGNILMAFSNKFGYLVLNTGNKSETSVGYCTLYGDMAGGFAVIKDVPKGLVYELARLVNDRGKREIIPKGIFAREPSAELRNDQRDQDTLPPYDLLDQIIDLYVEKNSSFGDIVKKVRKKEIVKDVLRMIDKNEYKRRQSPPGIKITPMAFGKDRRMPITNKFYGGEI